MIGSTGRICSGTFIPRHHPQRVPADRQVPQEAAAGGAGRREILRPVARALDYSHRKVIQLPSGDRTHGGAAPRREAGQHPDREREGRIHEVWLIDFRPGCRDPQHDDQSHQQLVDTRGTRPYFRPTDQRQNATNGRPHRPILRRSWRTNSSPDSLPFDAPTRFSLMLAITLEAAGPIPGFPEQVECSAAERAREGLRRNGLEVA